LIGEVSYSPPTQKAISLLNRKKTALRYVWSCDDDHD